MTEIGLQTYQQRVVRAPSRIGVREVVLHTVLLLVVLAATWIGFNTDQRTLVGVINPTLGVFSGVNRTEESERGTYRWTDGAATICLPQAGHAVRSLVQVTLAGDYALALGTTQAVLQPGHGPGVPIALQPGRRHYTLLHDGTAQTTPDLCMSVLSPAVADPNNNRQLGVPLYAFAANHLPLAGAVQPAWAHVALNSVLAIVAFWLIRGVGAPWWVATILVLSGALGAALALWSGLVPAGVNPLRLQIPLVLGLSGGLIGLIAAQRLPHLAPRTPRLARELFGMAAWSALLVGGFRALQWASGHSTVWPLKAGLDPNPTWNVLFAGAIFALWLWLLWWMTDDGRQAVDGGQATADGGQRTADSGRRTADSGPATADGRQRTADSGQQSAVNHRQTAVSGQRSAVNHRRPIIGSACVLFLGAVIIPVVLEVSILGSDSLYVVFRDSPYDYLRDTFRVGNDPLGFMRTYVAQAPQMALHTSTHPPGSVLFLWAVEQSLGPGAITTSWAAIILSALIVLAAYWLGWRLGGPRVALLAGVITVAMPGQLIYNVTSMDGLFNALNALGAVAFFLALEPPARPRTAILAGLLIALALFFTYATTQLAFFGLAAGAITLWRRPGWTTFRVLLRQGLIAAGVIVLIYVLIFLLTGFDVNSGSREATAENAEVMGRWLHGQTEQPFAPPSFAYYLSFVGANLAPYLWYVAPWGLMALSALLLAANQRHWRDLSTYDTLLVAIGACVLGMTLSGLFNREVERIWGFTYPLIAVLIAHNALQGDPQRQRWWPILYPTLFFLLGAAMKLLLNTVW
jgi:hypothetical protein